MASGHLRAPHKQAEQMAAPTSAAEPSKNPLPTGSRPQMANTGCSGHVATTVSYRVAGGGHPPPAPTERSVPISGTTLFGEGFTAQRMPGRTAGMAGPGVAAVTVTLP